MKYNTEKIWNEFSKNLFDFINSKVKNPDISSDILQDSFIKIHTNLDNLKDNSKLKSWVYQIVRNTINDYFKKKKLVLIDEYPEIEDKLNNKDNSCLEKCLTPFINNLEPKYSEAIKLTEIGELTQKQYAEALGISYSGAKSRVQRAKKQLKTLFFDCCMVEHLENGGIKIQESCEVCTC